ncbi:MAG: Ig-like domain-containing protein [bacterium]|nr:Ig-like domain-containing protein [bacterium]
MNVHIGKKGRILLIAVFAIIIGGIFSYKNNAFAENSEFYFFVDTGEPIDTLEITEDTTVYIAGILGSDEVAWVVGDDTIISATNSTGASGKYSLNIKCNKPGTTKISGTVARKVYNEVTGTTDVKYTSLTLTVTVKLKINNYTNTPNNLGKIFHLFEENEADQGSLVLNVGETFNLKLMVGEVHGDDLSWYSDYDENTTAKIASVSDTGKVTALSPGIAKVAVNTYKVSSDNNQTVLQSDYIYVVVKPQFTDESGKVLTSFNIDDPTKIYTNAKVSKNLSWVVKDTITNEVILDTYAGIKSDRVTLTTNSGDGNVVIDCKAGYYSVEIYPTYLSDSSLDLREAEKYPSQELELTEYVSFNFTNETVFVGNQFDLYKNSNVYDLSKFTIQALTNASVDTDTGIFTFTQEGYANIKITSNDSSLPIPDKYLEGGQGKWFADFLVVSSSSALNTITLKVGETYQCSIQNLPFESSLTWESLDKKVATVTTSGKVTAVATGTTTVRGVEVTKGGITKYHTWQVIVSPDITATLDKTTIEMSVGESETITASYKPNNADYIKVKWVISNTDSQIVEITSDVETPGYVNIKALAAGTVTLILQDQNSYQLAFCNITVKQPITEITLDQTDVQKTLQKNTALNQFTLYAKFKPNNPTDESLIWTSSDTSIATVVNGVVTYKKAGTTTIRVAPAKQSNSSSVYAECKLTVYQLLDTITLSDTTQTVNVGDAVKLSVSKYSPTQYVHDSDLVITWSTSNDTVVKVTTNTGLTPKLQAVGPGTCYITAETTSGVKTSCKITVLQYPTSIKLDKTNVTIDVGSSYTPQVTLTPSVLTNSTLTWESTNTNYVTVDKTGKITAKAAGKSGESTAQVIVTTADGKQRATINVTVRQRVTSFSLNYSKKTVTKGKTFTLKANIAPSNAENASVTWKTADKSIATVTSSGVVKGIKGGSVLITGTCNDTGETKYCLVVVEERVTTITLNKSSYILGKGKKYKLKATVKSNYATNQKLKWSTSNKKIATVSSNGTVTGKGYGYATITVKATDGSGASASCRVRVVRPVTKISLNKYSSNMVVGRTLKLKATVTPKNATIKTIKWSSSDENIAYVDSSGKVTAIAPGKCKIYAEAKDNSGVRAICTIFVSKETPATSVTIVNKDITLMIGETETLNYITNPGKTTDSVSWYSDDSRIVSVNKKTGKVKALRTGTANITVATSSGKSYTTTVKVVGLNRTTITMEQYDTYQLKVINGRSVQWDALNTDIVKVSNSGKISARKKGTTYVTAIVNGRKISCKVTVKKIK